MIYMNTLWSNSKCPQAHPSVISSRISPEWKELFWRPARICWGLLLTCNIQGLLALSRKIHKNCLEWLGRKESR